MYRVEVTANTKNAGTYADVLNTLEEVKRFANERIEELKETGLYDSAITKIWKSKGTSCTFGISDTSNPDTFKEIITRF